MREEEENRNFSVDRKEFLKLLEKSFSGAGSDDFAEYDFEDISEC